MVGVEEGRVMMPSNHRLAERRLISLVEDGRWVVDGDGRIWTVAVMCGQRPGGVRRLSVARRRTEKVVGSGYLMVRAMIDGRRVYGCAHRLVWQHFRGDIPEGLVVNHRNGAKDDNRPDNLGSSPTPTMRGMRTGFCA